MNKVNLIIAEKSNVAEKIVRAISPGSFDDRGGCDCLHKDIITLRPDDSDYNTRALEIQPNKKFYLSPDGCPQGYSIQAEHVSEQGASHSRSVKSRLKRMNGPDVLRSTRPVVFEEISYYTIGGQSEDFFVCDTSGSPYSFDFEGRSLLGLVLTSRNWKDLETKIWQVGSSDLRSFPPKTNIARNRFFNQLLSFNKMPDGQPIELNKIIAATDMDIAGAYIFLSVIEGAIKIAEKFNPKKRISTESIYRMNLTSLDPSDILNELKNLRGFNWGSAYAGKCRQTLDFIYGSSITGHLNHKKNIHLSSSGIKKESSAGRLRFSVGRNNFLGLRALIELDSDLENQHVEKENYLIFRGQADKDEIQTQLKKDSFFSVSIEKRKVKIGQAAFIKELRERDIGTHTTRYTLPTKFERLGLAKINGEIITPTEFARHLYYRLKKLLDSSDSKFPLSHWNKFLMGTMNYFKGMDSEGESLESIRLQFDSVMETILGPLKKQLSVVKSEAESVVKDLVDYVSDNGFPQAPKRIKKSVAGPIVLDGMGLAESSGVLRVDQIASFIDFKTNHVIAYPTIARYFSREIIKPHQLLKRICCLATDYEFDVLVGQKLDELETIDDEEFTVFRGVGLEEFTQENTLSKKIVKFIRSKKVGRASNFAEMDLAVPVSSEEGSSAHEPLDLGNPTFGLIDGPKGFLLAQEYQRPWNLTASKNTIINNGGVNVAGFNFNGLSFERVDRYKYSKAHNFESILSSMIEKYGISFIETARRMEEMYLSSK